MTTTQPSIISLTEKDEFVECKWRQIECDRPIEERGKKACVLCVLGGINQSLETIADALTPTKTRPIPESEWIRAIGFAQQHGYFPTTQPKRRNV